MVDVSSMKALFHRAYIFVMEPYGFSEMFTIVQATLHQLGNGSRESNEGKIRVLDSPFDLYQDASQYHASRKGWHKNGSVRERISDPGMSSISELSAIERRAISPAKLIQRMICKSSIL
jgi:hypothetical protein